jgi:colanic acid biosynthesis glycosyl transferase WcaI
MRFLILTQYFPPEIGGPQTRLRSIAAGLIRLGHQVEVITALPNYPTGKFFHGYRRRFYKKEIMDGVIIHRLWLYPAMGGGLRRMLNYSSFALTAFFGMLRAKKPDYIFVESPPPLLAVPGHLFSRLWRVPLILNVADLWPDAVVEMGFLKDGILVRLMTILEKWSYHNADYVSAVTHGIRDCLLVKKAVPLEKLLFMPNGVDTSLYHPRHSDEALKRALGLQDKSIFLWAGTEGHAHGLEYILRAAKLLEGYPDIHFLFVGDGSARPSLERLKQTLALTNVSFHDPVCIEELPRYFSIAECGLASLLALPIHEGARPSKIFPVLASGKPIIFVGSGEGARLVKDAGAGIIVRPEDPAAIAEAVLELAADSTLREEYGRNGRQFVEANLQWSLLIGRWIAGLRTGQPQTSAVTNLMQL